MKKILITGGAGFIGSHLSEIMLAEKAQVTVLDDLSTGSLSNIAHLTADNNFTFIEDRVQNTELLDELVKNCDYIYHLAAAVGVKLIVEQPIRTIKTNIYGTEAVLEAAAKYNKKLLIASTSEVYGKSDSVPFSEDDDVIYGSTKYSRWSYACSKAIDEFLALAFYQQYGLEVLVTRFFNTVGPRQTGQYGMVVPRFVRAALANQPITVYGSGKQTRCFSYVGDVVKGAKELMECGRAFGQVFNLGCNEEISIEGLAAKIIQLCQSESKVSYMDYKQAYGREFDDMMRRVPSLEKATKTIGYKPQFSLEDTLKAVIEYEKSVKSAKS
ncbi:MAG: GDP-mannose 4,6-dehydratase [Sedimentisphaeraceae bacterium JB056]